MMPSLKLRANMPGKAPYRKVKNVFSSYCTMDHGPPKLSFFRRYDPYLGGLKPSFFMVLGSKEGECLCQHHVIEDK